MVEIIILSLKNSERRIEMIRKLEVSGIKNYTFFDAIDARNKRVDSLSDFFNMEESLKHNKRIISAGEAACTLGHIGILKKISQSNNVNWVVLEDDAILTNRFIKLLKKDNQPSSLTILGYPRVSRLKSFLYNFKRSLSETCYKNGYRYGRKKRNKYCGTVGYFITKRNAIDIVKNLPEKPFHIADDWDYLGRFLDIYHAKPLLILEDYKKLSSLIEDGRNKARVESNK